MAETQQQPTMVEIVRREVAAAAALVRPRQAALAWIMAAGLVLLPVSGRVALFEFCLSIALVAVLAALVVIDREHFRLPDALTLPLIAAGVLLVPPHAFLDTLERLAAAMLAFGLLYGVAEGYRHWRGHTGLGLGDVKLFAAAGAWVTVAGLPSVLLIGALSAIAVTVVLAFRRGDAVSRMTRIAFGPYLALGLWLVWLFGPLL